VSPYQLDRHVNAMGRRFKGLSERELAELACCLFGAGTS
jgi:hypothetical protein